MEQYFMPWIGKLFQLMGQLMVLISVLMASCTLQPNMEYLPSHRPTATQVDNNEVVIASSENYTLLATATPDPYATKWVDFGHEGYPTSAALSHGEVIAYVQCFRDKKPYVLQFSSLEDGSQTEAISPEDCLGLDNNVGIEVAVATTNDQWYVPRCDIEVDPNFEECDTYRTLLDPDYLPAEVVVPEGVKIRFWNFKIWGSHRMVLVLGSLE